MYRIAAEQCLTDLSHVMAFESNAFTPEKHLKLYVPVSKQSNVTKKGRREK